MNISEKLTTIAENEQKVFEAGRKAEHDTFWDIYQNKGARRQYNYAFNGDYSNPIWNDTNFKPKYDIKATTLAYAFQYSRITDLAQILEDCGVKLTFPKTSVVGAALYYAFQASTVTHIPELNCPTVTNFQNAFHSCTKLEQIDKLTVSSTAAADGAFLNCYKLKELRVGMEINYNWSLYWSPLSKASIKHIVGALSDSATGKKMSFNLNTVKKEFETASGAKDGNTSEEWATLISTKPNWTISLMDA